MNSFTGRPAAASAPRAPGIVYSPFVPLLLTVISLVVVLGWTMGVTIRQTNNLQSLKFQVWHASAQSVQAEEKLKAMLSDLIDLAETDSAAAAIVKRYKIKQNAAAPAVPEAMSQAPQRILSPVGDTDVKRIGEVAKPRAKPAVSEPAAPPEPAVKPTE